MSLVTTAVSLLLISFVLVTESRSYHGRVRMLERSVRALTKDVEALKNENIEIKQWLMNTTKFGKREIEQWPMNTTHIENSSDKEPSTSNTNLCSHNRQNHVKHVMINRIKTAANPNVSYDISYSFALEDKEIANEQTFSYWNYYSDKFGFTPLKGGITPSPINESMAKAHIEVTPQNNSSVMFVFGTDSIWYSVKINNSIHTSQERNLTLPQLYLVPDEIVQTASEPSKFQIVVSDDISLPRDFSLSQTYIYDSDTSSMTRDTFEPPIPTDFGNGTLCGRKRIVANMDWTNVSLSYSGVLTVKLEKNLDNGLEYVHVYKRIIFRPYNQSGPFPDHVFEFYPSYLETKVSPGKFVQLCRSGKQCKVLCTAVGSNFTEMTVSNKHGILKQQTIRNRFHIAEISVDVPLTRRSRVICEATNKKGIIIRHTVLVKLASRPTIPRINVYYEKEKRNLIINCKSRGFPKPHIRIFAFSWEYSRCFTRDVSNSTRRTWVAAHITPPIDHGGRYSIQCDAQNTEGDSTVTKEIQNFGLTKRKAPKNDTKLPSTINVLN